MERECKNEKKTKLMHCAKMFNLAISSSFQMYELCPFLFGVDLAFTYVCKWYISSERIRNLRWINPPIFQLLRNCAFICNVSCSCFT